MKYQNEYKVRIDIRIDIYLQLNKGKYPDKYRSLFYILIF